MVYDGYPNIGVLTLSAHQVMERSRSPSRLNMSEGMPLEAVPASSSVFAEGNSPAGLATGRSRRRHDTTGSVESEPEISEDSDEEV